MFRFLIEKFIFLYSRRIPNKLRNCLLKLFYYKNKFLTNDKLFKIIDIELNGNCNRSCNYCPVSMNLQKKDILPIAVLKKISSELKEINYNPTIAITGFHEPLLDERIFQISSLLRRNHKKNLIIIYTNGDFLTQKKINFFKKNRITLNISLHEPINKRLERLLKKNKKNNYLNFRKNISKLNLSSRLGTIKSQKQAKSEFCIDSYSILSISSSGNVKLCCSMFDDRITFGDIRHENIIDIWFKKDFVKLRDDIARGKNLPNICKKCLNTS